MAAAGQPPAPPLQKPPGFRDSNIPITRPVPPKPVASLPPSFRPKKGQKRSFCRICCCCLCISLVMLIFLLISVFGLLYVFFQPRLPEIHLRSFRITTFNVTTTPDGPTLDCEANVGLEFWNPNQNLRLQYGRTKISINTENVEANLGEVTVPGFVQERLNVTMFKFSTRAEDVILDQKSARTLTNGFRKRDLKVEAEVRTEIGFRAGGLGTGTVPVRVVCPGLSLDQKSDSVAPKCQVQMLNLFFLN